MVINKFFNPDDHINLKVFDFQVFSDLETELHQKMAFFNSDDSNTSEDCYEEFSNFINVDSHKYFSYQILFRYIRKKLNIDSRFIIDVSKCIIFPPLYLKMKEHDLRIFKILHPTLSDETYNKELGWLELDFYPSCLTDKIDNFSYIFNLFQNSIFLKKDFTAFK